MRFRNALALGGLFLLIGVTGCKKDREPNKIIDGVPVNVTETVIPGQIAQQYVLLNQAGLAVVVPILNRLGSNLTAFPEVTGPTAQLEYTFSATGPKYGTANFIIQFRDETQNAIDPITLRSSTASVANVRVQISGSSNLFSYTADVVITLETVGIMSSSKRMTGTATFNGQGYTNLIFTLQTIGNLVSFEGFSDGTLSVAGSGPSAPVTMNLSFNDNHDGDGTIQWETFEGNIHLDNEGSGFVITNQSRILLY